MESIIGKTYIAKDNSYMINLTNPDVDFRLAGTLVDKEHIPVTIVSEPYELPKETVFLGEGSTTKIYKFINVTHQGYVISVMYFEDGVVK